MTLTPGALVLYKQKPARIAGQDGDKLEIETPGGRVRVRPKDVTPLHPGPFAGLGSLRPLQGDARAVWELVEGESFSLRDLADLAFGSDTPDTALAVWDWIRDGTYFTGTPDLVTPRPAESVQAALDAQAAEQAQARAWQDFIDGVRRGEVSDPRRLGDVEALALGRTGTSRVLAALGRPETPESAHTLLLALGVWDETRNPHPARHGADTRPVDLPLPDTSLLNVTDPSRLDPNGSPDAVGSRLDLTHLVSLAIDDEGSSDPDDALSLERHEEGLRLWVHVSDVAALVAHGSDLDREARRRGATLYLPEGTSPMLPPAATDLLGLGLSERSPALSFAIDLGDDLDPTGRVEVHPSVVRVTRLTYAEAQGLLDTDADGDVAGVLNDLRRFALRARARRAEAGAVLLDLPEVRVRIVDGDVTLTPLPPLLSRVVVQEAMMLTGWATATWATERDLALPFAQQDPPLQRRGDADARMPDPVPAATTDSSQHTDPEADAARAIWTDLPENWARRKTLARTRFAPAPGRHAGLGLEAYAQATSPMRRYLDLVVHQQIRAELAGERTLSGREIAALAAEADLGAGGTRTAERASNRHWTLVFLRRHPGWQGEGTVVERRGPVATVLLPDLALDVTLPIADEVGSAVTLAVAEVDLPTLSTRWSPR